MIFTDVNKKDLVDELENKMAEVLKARKGLPYKITMGNVCYAIYKTSEKAQKFSETHGLFIEDLGPDFGSSFTIHFHVDANADFDGYEKRIKANEHGLTIIEGGKKSEPTN